MSTVEKKKYYTPEEYFAIDEAHEFKCEYYNGNILDLTGGTFRHSQINVNVMCEIANLVDREVCTVLGCNLRVEISHANAYVYPDTQAFWGDPELVKGRDDTIKNPVLVVEVLSEGTETWNRGGKFHNYQKLESLKEYVVVESESPQVDVFRRSVGNQWIFESYFGLDDSVRLESLGIVLPMCEIYHKVVFG